MPVGVFNLQVTSQGFAVIWQLLGQAPAGQVRDLMNELQQQVSVQENTWTQAQSAAELEQRKAAEKEIAERVVAEKLAAEQLARSKVLGPEQGFVDPNPQPPDANSTP